MEELKIISKEETNSFCDESKANNGGGYSQPYYEFEYAGWHGNFYNTSCGDFGTRLSASVEKDTQGYRANWGSMDGEEQYSDFPEKFPADGFYEAFEERFGFGIPTEEDMQTEWDDE